MPLSVALLLAVPLLVFTVIAGNHYRNEIRGDWIKGGIFWLVIGAALLGLAFIYRAYAALQKRESHMQDMERSAQGLREKLAEKNREFETLSHLSSVISESIKLEPTLATIYHRMCEVMGTDKGGIYLKEPDGSFRLAHKTDGMPEELLSLIWKILPGQGVTGRAVKEKKIIKMRIKDYEVPGIKEKMTELGVKSIISCPILVRGEAIGAITFCFTGQVEWPSESECLFLSSISNQVAAAIKNARLFEEVEKGKKEWEMTFDSIKDPIFINDNRGNIIRANAEFAKYINKDFRSFIGRPWNELLISAEWFGGKFPLELEKKREVSDRQGRTFLLNHIPVYDDAGLHAYSVHVARDITALKAAQEMLRQEADVSNAIVRLSEIVNSILDREGLIREVLGMSPGYIRMDALGIFLCWDILGYCSSAGNFGFTPEEEQLLSSVLLNHEGPGFFKKLYSGKEVLISRSGMEGLPEEILNKLKMETVLVVPMMHKNEFLGVLIGANRKSPVFDQRDVGLLKGLSNSLAAALKNASLYKQIQELFLGAIKSLTSAIDAKSAWTRGHSERVTQYALAIGKRLELEEEPLKRLELAGLLHDVGKIGTIDSILEKEGELTEEEFESVKLHPLKGAEIVAGIKQLRDVAEIIKYHHERPDGKGYPYGLKENNIPLFSRIIAVADAYDSMTSVRPYREIPGKEYAISELRKNAGTQFDPRLVDLFLQELRSSRGE